MFAPMAVAIVIPARMPKFWIGTKLESAKVRKPKKSATVVYTIGYDLDATAPGTNVCRNGVNNAIESPSITAYSALQQMASPGNFYNHPSATDLSAIFQAIAFDINEGKSRLFN